MCYEAKVQKLQMGVALDWLALIEKSEQLITLDIDVAHNRGVIRHAKERYAETFTNMVKRSMDHYGLQELDITEKFFHV